MDPHGGKYLILMIVVVPHFLFDTEIHASITVYSFITHQQLAGPFTSVQSKFGPHVPPEGLEGLLVMSEPEEACSEVAPPPPNVTNIFGNWILLIKRGTCKFECKVRNAQKKNYTLAIIYNNETGIGPLLPMSAENKTGIIIPSIFIQKYIGKKMQNDFAYRNDVYIFIDDNNDFPFDVNADLLIPFAVVIAICFITMISFMICKCVRDQRRARRHRLPTSSLRKIPIEKFMKGSPFETCAICLEDYMDGEKLRVLPCVHAYHTKCIDPWLTRNRRVCPICKRKVFAADETPIEGSDSDSDTDHDERTPLVRNNDPSQSTQPQIQAQSSSQSSSSSSSNIGQPLQLPYLLSRERIMRHFRMVRNYSLRNGWNHTPLINEASSSNTATTSSRQESQNQMPITDHNAQIATVIRSINSDDDSIIDISPSCSIASLNYSTTCVYQFPNNHSIVTDNSDTHSRSFSSTSEIETSEHNNNQIV